MPGGLKPRAWRALIAALEAQRHPKACVAQDRALTRDHAPPNSLTPFDFTQGELRTKGHTEVIDLELVSSIRVHDAWRRFRRK